MAEERFKPGDRVPHSGVFLVYHQGHRRDHEATLMGGQLFPECARCGDQVRFRMLRAAESIDRDRDFRVKRAAGRTSG